VVRDVARDGQVLDHSRHPYLSLRLKPRPGRKRLLVWKLGDRAPSPPGADRGLFVARLDEPLLDAVLKDGEAARYAGGYRRAQRQWYSGKSIIVFARRTRVPPMSRPIQRAAIIRRSRHRVDICGALRMRC